MTSTRPFNLSEPRLLHPEDLISAHSVVPRGSFLPSSLNHTLLTGNGDEGLVAA